MPDARPMPTVIGATENALRALLTKTLSTTLIDGYRAWVVLNAASNAGATTNGNWKDAVADALKAKPGEVDETLAALRAAGMIDEDSRPTAAGAAELAKARPAVFAVTSRLTDGLGEEQQMTARLVLDYVRGKAEALLRV